VRTGVLLGYFLVAEQQAEEVDCAIGLVSVGADGGDVVEGEEVAGERVDV